MSWEMEDHAIQSWETFADRQTACHISHIEEILFVQGKCLQFSDNYMPSLVSATFSSEVRLYTNGPAVVKD